MKIVLHKSQNNLFPRYFLFQEEQNNLKTVLYPQSNAVLDCFLFQEE